MSPRHAAPQPPSHRRVLLLASAALLLGAVGCGNGTVEGPNGNDESGSYDHRLAAGASARDFLTAGSFDRLVVQVQYVAGARPTDGALARLETFLAARLNKPDGITIQLGAQLQSQAQPSYSTADVRALEQQHRTTYTDGRSLAAYVLFLDGEYAEGSNVLGIAYNNTSMAVFAEKIGEFTGGALQPSQETVETTVTQHEFGHVLGLVNNGSPMQVEHQDEPNGAHCDNDKCLMHYAVRLSDFIANLLGGVPGLDQNCLDDLQSNGGK